MRQRAPSASCIWRRASSSAPSKPLERTQSSFASRESPVAMKYLHLLWANLQRKRLRTWLTLASIVVAFLLFGVLQTMRAALTGGASLAGVDRLMTIHKVSLIQPLPASYLNRVRAVEGVRVATSLNW